MIPQTQQLYSWRTKMAEAVDQLLRNRCVAAFNANQPYLAIVVANVSLRIWQTLTNTLAHEYIPAGHLSSRITAICWLPGGQAANIDRNPGNKQQKTVNGTKLIASYDGRSTQIALGLARGGVVLYDMLAGDIAGRIAESERYEKITSICAAETFSSLPEGSDNDREALCYAVTQGGHVLAINVHARRIEKAWRNASSTGDASLYSCCLLDSDSKLVVGGRGSISVWDVSMMLSNTGNPLKRKQKQSPRLLWTTIAHANPVLQMKTVRCPVAVSSSLLNSHRNGNSVPSSRSDALLHAEYILVAANNEQWLSVWRLNVDDSSTSSSVDETAAPATNENLLSQHGSLSFAEQGVAHIDAVISEHHLVDNSVEHGGDAHNSVTFDTDNAAGSSSSSLAKPRIETRLTASVCSASGKLYVYTMRLRRRAHKNRSPRSAHCVVRFAAETRIREKNKASKNSGKLTIPVIAAYPRVMPATNSVEIAVAYGGGANDALAIETMSVDALPAMSADGDDFVLIRKDPAALARSEFSVVNGISIHDVPGGDDAVTRKRCNDSSAPEIIGPGLQTYGRRMDLSYDLDDDSSFTKPSSPTPKQTRSAKFNGMIEDEDETEREIDPSVMTVADQLLLIEGSDAKNKPTDTVQASGLVELIKQGLRSQDNELITSVISRGDHAIISKTVAKLTITNVIPLLTAIINNVTSQKATHDAAPCLWLKQLLITHGTFLAAAPDARKHLQSLSAILDARLRTFHSLLRLKGKLELLAAQRKAVKRATRSSRRHTHHPVFGAASGDRIPGHTGLLSHAAAAVVHESDEDDDEDGALSNAKNQRLSGTTVQDAADEDESEDEQNEAVDDDASDDDDEFFGKAERNRKRRKANDKAESSRENDAESEQDDDDDDDDNDEAVENDDDEDDDE